MLRKQTLSPNFSISPPPDALSQEEIQKIVPENDILSVSPILDGHSTANLYM